MKLWSRELLINFTKGMESSQGAREEKEVIKATKRPEALLDMSVSGKFHANICGIWGCYYRQNVRIRNTLVLLMLNLKRSTDDMLMNPEVKESIYLNPSRLSTKLKSICV